MNRIIVLICMLFALSCVEVSSNKKTAVSNDDVFLDENIELYVLSETLIIRSYTGEKLPEEVFKSNSVKNVEFIGRNNLNYNIVFEQLKDFKISEIIFRDSSIDNKIVDSITMLSTLKSVKLYNCDAYNIIHAVCKIESIEVIDLSFSNIQSVPNCLLNNTQIKKIILSNTHIKDIPDQIKQLTNLEYFDIENTMISELPKTFVECKKMKHLCLGSTPLAKEVLKYIKKTRQNEFNVKDYGNLNFIIKEIPTCSIHLRLKPVGQDYYPKY